MLKEKSVSRSEVSLSGLAEAIKKNATVEAINVQLVKFSLPPVQDPDVGASHVARAAGIKNQGDATVLLLNLTGGKIDYDEMTKVLKATFPQAGVTGRHGPHYISQVRTGKIAGLDPGVTVPAKQRGVKAGSTTASATPATPAAKPAKAPAKATAATPPPAPEPVVPVVDTAALHAELMALPMKDIVARAKAAGVKAVGTKETLVKALVALA